MRTPGDKGAQAAGRPGETVADWLALHGLDAERCTAILDAVAPAPAAPSVPGDPIDHSAEEVLQIGCTALAGFFPADMRAEVLGQLQALRVVTDPDRIRALRGTDRAMTLDTGGAGTPVVLCPYRRRLQDAKALLHEMAHGLQYMRARERGLVPPSWRESFAFVGEQALMTGFSGPSPDIAQALSLVWQKDSHVFLGSYARQLRAALPDVATPYAYRWNYALGRAVFPNLALKSEPYQPLAPLDPGRVRSLASGEAPV